MTFLPDCMNTTELSEKGITVPVLRLDNGEPLVNGEEKVTITIKGPDSKVFRDAENAINAKRLKAVAAGGDFDDERAKCELLAAVTMAWTGMHDGKTAAPCTPDNAVQLYMAFPAVRDQVFNRVHSRRFFIKGSSLA